MCLQMVGDQQEETSDSDRLICPRSRAVVPSDAMNRAVIPHFQHIHVARIRGDNFGQPLWDARETFGVVEEVDVTNRPIYLVHLLSTEDDTDLVFLLQASREGAAERIVDVVRSIAAELEPKSKVLRSPLRLRSRRG
jgi:hypothetical protein